MKYHFFAVSVLLGILMSLVTVASNAAETAPADMPNTVAVDATPRVELLSRASLTSKELATLHEKEAQSPELRKQAAAGCRTVWDNDTQKEKTMCYNPNGMGFALGFFGVLIGSFGGVGGAVVGGAVGYGIGYAITP